MGGNGCLSLDGEQQFNISGGFKIVKIKLNHIPSAKNNVQLRVLTILFFLNKKDFSAQDRFQRCSMNKTRVCSNVTYIKTHFSYALLNVTSHLPLLVNWL